MPIFVANFIAMIHCSALNVNKQQNNGSIGRNLTNRHEFQVKI